MNIIRYKYIAALPLAVASLALASCNDFLNKYPDSRMDLKNSSEVSQLLVSAYPAAHPAYLTEMYSDNTDEQMHSTWSAFDRFQEQAYQWKDIDEVRNAETPYQLWEAHYTAVATANEAIAHINSVNNAHDYDAQLGEALLCRAFAMFQLSTVFCQAYDKTTAQNNLGLAYPTEPEKVVGRLIERGTLAQLYNNIEKDLLQGLELVGTKYARPKFHFTKQAAYAFATRFYLYAQQYDKAVKYANLVLGEQPTDVLRNWTEWNRLGPSGNVQPNAFVMASNNANILLLPVPSEWGVISIPVLLGSKYAHGQLLSKTETLQAAGPWGDSGNEMLYSVTYNNGVSKYALRKIPYVPRVLDVSAGIGIPYSEFAVFNTDATLLERAEAYALSGQYDKAVNDINAELSVFTKKKTQITLDEIVDFYGSLAYYTPTKPTPKKALNPLFTIEKTTQEPLLQCILQLRRLLTMHEGFRLQDVKRYGITMYRRQVDVQSNVTAVTDSMKTGDPRLAIQLPQDVISAGVTPNPRNK